VIDFLILPAFKLCGKITGCGRAKKYHVCGINAQLVDIYSNLFSKLPISSLLIKTRKRLLVYIQA
jgi:hypothetical protein